MSRQYFEDYFAKKGMVVMPKEKFIAEHTKLIDVLEKGDPKQLKKEKAEQSKELHSYLQKQPKSGSGNTLRRMTGRVAPAQPPPPPPPARRESPPARRESNARRGSEENRRMMEAMGEDERPRPVMRRQNAVRRGTDSSGSSFGEDEEEEDPSPASRRASVRPPPSRRSSDPRTEEVTREELERRAYNALSPRVEPYLRDDVRRMIRRMSLRELQRAYG